MGEYICLSFISGSILDWYHCISACFYVSVTGRAWTLTSLKGQEGEGAGTLSILLDEGLWFKFSAERTFPVAH